MQLNNWKMLCGTAIDDISITLINHIQALIEKYDKKNIKLITACDSQRRGSKITYVTVIIVLNTGFGGNAFYLKEIEDCSEFLYKNTNSRAERLLKVKALIQKRLWNETLKAVECAMAVDELVYNLGLKVSEVHADINTNKKFKSSELSKAIIGYIDACGFIPKVKPDAWGASGIANIKTK